MNEEFDKFMLINHYIICMFKRDTWMRTVDFMY